MAMMLPTKRQVSANTSGRGEGRYSGYRFCNYPQVYACLVGQGLCNIIFFHSGFEAWSCWVDGDRGLYYIRRSCNFASWSSCREFATLLVHRFFEIITHFSYVTHYATVRLYPH